LAVSEAAAVNPLGLPFREYAPRYLHVLSKRDGEGFLPFHLNPVQEKLDAILEGIERAGKPVRILILKARQQGVSTYSLGRAYAKATRRFGFRGFVVAQDDPTTQELFDRVRTMYDMAPDPRPMSRYSNRTMLDFSNPDRDDREHPGLRSSIVVATAGRRGVGRGFTLHYLHCSEIPLWDGEGAAKNPRKAKRALLGLLQCVPSQPGTTVILEATANGVGDEFHRRWVMAQDPATAGDWIPVFFGWWEFHEYTRPIVEGIWEPIPQCAESPEAFEREEAELKEQYRLTDEQLNWRRWAIVNLCGNDLDLFRQEYPASPEEAFLMSGRPFMHRAKLQARLNYLQAEERRLAAEGKRRYIVGKMGRTGSGPRVRACVVEDATGLVRIYVKPKPGHEYVLSADVAEGLTVGEDDDRSVASVWDRYSGEQCATVYGRQTPEVFARELFLLGSLYNNALLVPESNNHGQTICLVLQQLGYPELYMRRTFDQFGANVLHKPGWATNPKTRSVACDSIRTAVVTDLARLNDLRWIQEFQTVVIDDRGKAAGQSGCHDDCFMEAAIGWGVMLHGPEVDRKRSKFPPPAEPGTDAEIIQRSKQAALKRLIEARREETL
jgi:hypothetical protein